MKFNVTHLLYAVLVLAVAGWLISSWNSDKRRIERQLKQLRQLIEKEGAESDLVAVNKARQLGLLLSRDFEIHVQPYAQVLSDRQQLSRVVLQYRRNSQRIGVDFSDRDLVIDKELRMAGMDVLAVVTGSLDGNAYRERYRLRLDWIEEEGEWLLRRIDLVEILEGPAAWP